MSKEQDKVKKKTREFSQKDKKKPNDDVVSLLEQILEELKKEK